MGSLIASVSNIVINDVAINNDMQLLLCIVEATNKLYDDDVWDAHTVDRAGRGVRLLERHHASPAGRFMFAQVTAQSNDDLSVSVQEFLKHFKTTDQGDSVGWVIRFLLPRMIESMKTVPHFDFR